MAKEQIRFTGSGGQGVIMGTIIIAEAAFLDGRKVVQSQSYGPEARGGMCKAETIVSDSEIFYTKVEKPDLLLSLTQKSFDKYCKRLSRRAIIVIDDSITVPPRIAAQHEVLSLPILRSAKDVIKNKMSANIISCGAVNEALHLASVQSLKEAVLNHVPPASADSNVVAMELGARLVREARGEASDEASEEARKQAREDAAEA